MKTTSAAQAAGQAVLAHVPGHALTFQARAGQTCPLCP